MEGLSSAHTCTAARLAGHVGALGPVYGLTLDFSAARSLAEQALIRIGELGRKRLEKPQHRRHGADVLFRAITAELEAEWRRRLVVALQKHWSLVQPEASPYYDIVADLMLRKMASLAQSAGAKWTMPEAFADDLALQMPAFSGNDPKESCEAWCRNGYLHRDPAAGPAFSSAVNGLKTTCYWVDGKLHRPHGDGPAHIEELGGGGRREQYYRQGVLHRPAGDGPALTEYDARGRVRAACFYEDGKLHRPQSDGPAARRVDEHGRLIVETYFRRGKLHRDPSSGPAEVLRDGAYWDIEAYFVDGELHRDSRTGPAVIGRERHTGRIKHLAYWEHGVEHRDPARGPASIEISFEDGVTCWVRFIENGKLHRPHAEGPAERWLWAGGSSEERYFALDVIDRPSCAGPAVQSYDAQGRLRYMGFYEGGEFHRHPLQGPAEIFAGDAELDIAGGRRFYWRGKELPCPLAGLPQTEPGDEAVIIRE